MCGFDGHKRVKGRKRHILMDTLGLVLARRIEPAGVSDQKAGTRLLGGLRLFFPAIRTVMADAGHQSRKLALRHDRLGFIVQSLLQSACIFLVAGRLTQEF